MQVFVATACICAPQATDRDPQSFNVNVWIYARRATVILRVCVNAWKCAPRSTDRDFALDKNLQYL